MQTALTTQERFLAQQNIYILPFQLCLIYIVQVRFVKLAVILLMVCTVKHFAQDARKNGKAFLTIVRNSVAICNAKSGLMQSANYLRYILLAFSVGNTVWLTLWSGIISKLDESVPLFPLTANLGDDQSDYVLLLHHLEDTRHVCMYLLIG